MNPTIEENHISENIKIEDNKGLKYYLEVLNTFDENQQLSSVFIDLFRDKRNCQVGKANLIISGNDGLIGDIIIEDKVKSSSLDDRFYRMLHPLEPSNYQKRGLGTILLKYIINVAKIRGIKTLHCSLTHQDISNNPNLINWYKKHNFMIEEPTKDEVNTAKYRACLYLN